MRTNQKYINEFSLFEEAMECYESVINDIIIDDNGDYVIEIMKGFNF